GSRLLDRHGRRPLVAGRRLGTRVMPLPQVDLAALRRILVVRLDNIGDVVMLSPALRAIRAALPEVHITLFTSPAGASAAPLLPWVGHVVVWSALWQQLDPAFSRSP